MVLVSNVSDESHGRHDPSQAAPQNNRRVIGRTSEPGERETDSGVEHADKCHGYESRRLHFAERRASPTAAGEAGGAHTQYSNSPGPPSGNWGRRLGAGAGLSTIETSPIYLVKRVAQTTNQH